MNSKKSSRRTNVLRSMANQVTQHNKSNNPTVIIHKVLHTPHFINEVEDDLISDFYKFDFDKVIYEPNKVT